MNAKQVNASPAVIREEFTSMETKTFSGALTLMSPDTKAVVLTAQMDFDEMVPLWTCAILSLERDAVLKDIERHTGGVSDRLGKYAAIALPGDAYLVQFAPRLIAGAMMAISYVPDQVTQQLGLKGVLVPLLSPSQSLLTTT